MYRWPYRPLSLYSHFLSSDAHTLALPTVFNHRTWQNNCIANLTLSKSAIFTPHTQIYLYPYSRILLYCQYITSSQLNIFIWTRNSDLFTTNTVEWCPCIVPLTLITVSLHVDRIFMHLSQSWKTTIGYTKLNQQSTVSVKLEKLRVFIYADWVITDKL